MTRELKGRRTQRFLEGHDAREFRAFEGQATRRLTALDNKSSLRDLAGLPSNKLELLSGDRAGRRSIRINRPWRICFQWGDDRPYDVEIVDYHR